MRPEPELIPGMVLPARLPRGFVLGEHVVDGWLRDGGMAAIYRAHRASDGRRVAVKLQLPPTVRHPGLGERFEREAEVLWRVRGSEHVVELFDVGMLDDGRRYLVMEWVEGEDLEELLDYLRDQDQLLPVARACRIVRDVARGLAALHEHGVVHLDLKPANVMIGRDDDGGDDVVLVDFGIAADLRSLAVPGDDVPGETLLGTSGYTSPQRARGEAPSPSCDVYALGVLLFEALSGGCVPPDGWSPQTLPRVDALRHGVPPALAELVCMCMRGEPGCRPASAKVVATVLDAIVGALEMSVRGGLQALARPGGTQVALVVDATRKSNDLGMEAGLIAVEEPPPPTLPGGTEVGLPIDPLPVDPADTEVGLPIDPLPVDPADTEVGLPIDPDLEKTFELLPQQPQPPDEADDTEPTFELRPQQQPEHGLAAAGGSEAPAEDVRAAAPASGSEWLGREPRWWLSWVVAAGVLAVTAPAAAWLLRRGIGQETTATSAATTSTRALEPMDVWAQPLGGEEAPSAANEPPPPEVAAVPQPPAPTQAAPELEVEERSEPVVASEPSPRPSQTDAVERARAQAAVPSEAACVEARARADVAKRNREWEAVLQATSRRRCWSGPELRVTRARLRVTAYAELGELERCVAEGTGKRDREIAARTALCRKKLGGT